MTIVSDLHGVFIDSFSIMKLRSEVTEKLLQVKISPEDYRKDKVIGDGWLNTGQYGKVSREVYGKWEYVSRMEPIKGYEYFCDFIKHREHRLIILTSVVDEMLVCAKQWLKNHNIGFERIVGVGTGGDRIGLLKDYEANVYIDDRIENLAIIREDEDLKKINLFLMKGFYPCEQNISGVKIVNNLKDLAMILERV